MSLFLVKNYPEEDIPTNVYGDLTDYGKVDESDVNAIINIILSN